MEIGEFIKTNWKKAILIILGIIILAATLIGAFAIQISPDTFNEEVIKDQAYNYSFSIEYNNATPHNFTIYNVTFNSIPGFTFTKIANLSKNETKTISAFVNANTIVDTNYVSKLTYYYLTQSTASPVVRNISIGSGGFNPFSLNAVLNDTLFFTNKDTINHTITDMATSTSHKLVPNQTLQIAMTEIKTYNYVDEQTSTGLNVNVATNIIQSPTVNPSYDIPFTFRLKSVYPKTALNLSFTPPKSALDYDETSLGVLIFRPINPVYNISLSSDNWITFDSNNFDITNGEKVVFLTLTSQNITQTDQTGKSYAKTIHITADNTEPQDISFSVSINQHNFTSSSGTQNTTTVIVRLPTLDEQRAMCESVGYNDTFCLEKIAYQNQTVYVNRTLDPNLNEQDVVDFFGKQGQDSSDVDTLKSTVQTELDDTQKGLEDVKNRQTTLENILMTRVLPVIEKIDAFMENFRTNKNVRTLGVILLMTIVGVFGYAYYKKNIAKKKELAELSEM